MRTRSLQGWAFLGPALLVTAALFLAPMAVMILTSLQPSGPAAGGPGNNGLTLANYERILTDSTFLLTFQNSLEVVTITVVVSLLLAYPFAYIVAFHVPERWQALLLLAVVLPFWTSYVVRSYSWLLVLAKKGVVNSTLLSLGVIGEPLTLANTRLATVTAFVHFFIMVCALTIYASLRRIPRSLTLAARDLGASATATFMRIVLPLSLPGVLVGAFLVFVLAIGDFITPQIVGGGNELLLPQMIMLQVTRRGDLPLAAALAVLLLAVVAVVYAALARRLTLVGRT